MRIPARALLAGLALTILPLAILPLEGGPDRALAQAGEATRPPPDSFLNEQALAAEFTDRALEGCYPDGSPWAERTAADGSLYDLLLGDVRVGAWEVVGDANGPQICYVYDGSHGHQPGVACWNVARDAGRLVFFAAGEGLLGGMTDCVDLVAQGKRTKSSG